MLVGMGLYKLGAFSAAWSANTYKKMILAAVLVGLPLVFAGVWFREANDWSLEAGFFGGSQFNYWGSLFVAFGVGRGHDAVLPKPGRGKVISFHGRHRPDGPHQLPHPNPDLHYTSSTATASDFTGMWNGPGNYSSSWLFGPSSSSGHHGGWPGSGSDPLNGCGGP